MKRYVLATAALALLVAAGIGWAAIPSSGDSAVISGCYGKTTGLLRVIDAQAGKTCMQWETPISWSQAGPKGEQGIAGPQGAKGEKGDQGAQGPKGDQGAVGEAGAVGATGPPGPQGPKGDKGDPGDAGAAGAVGPKGDKGDAGSGVTWRGSYDSLVTYTSGDLVRHGGAVWLGLRSNFVCTPSPSGSSCRWVAPGADATYWQLFAQDGSQGPTGATGPQGPAGPAKQLRSFRVRSDTNFTGQQVGGSWTATCPSGSVLAGGGATVTSGWIDQEWPYPNVESPNGWAANFSEPAFGRAAGSVYAVCMKLE